MKKYFFIILIQLFFGISIANAQCSMCTANAENGIKNGNTQTIGLNKGVLYLLSFPFVLVGGVGTLWYVKFRNKSEDSK